MNDLRDNSTGTQSNPTIKTETKKNCNDILRLERIQNAEFNRVTCN